MDETDLRLSQLLMQDCRRPYRELAKELSISAQAVHRRLQALREAGVVHSVCALPAQALPPRVDVVIFGRADVGSLEDVLAQLDRDPRVVNINVASGNYLIVVGALQDLSYLEAFGGFVRSVTRMRDLQVGIGPLNTAFGSARGPPAAKARPLTDLDVRIIRSLGDDARRPASELAEELGVSTKTVNRHLNRMRREGSVFLSIAWDPTASGDIISLLHLGLDGDADARTVAAAMLRIHSPRVVNYYHFNNLPDHLFLLTWSRTLKDLDGLQRTVGREPHVHSVVAHILYGGSSYEAWRDKVLGGA